MPTSQTPDSTKGTNGPTSLPTDPAALLTDRVLEQTSIADFIRALSAIAVPEDATAYLREQQPKRKVGMARVGLLPSRADPGTRRPSMAPAQPSVLRQAARRRCSLMPVEEHLLSSHDHLKGRLGLAPTSSARSSFKSVAHARRRFSVRPAALPTLASASNIDSTAPSSMPMMSTVPPPSSIDSTSAPTSMKAVAVFPTIISSSSPKVSSSKSVSIVAPNDVPYDDSLIREGVVSSTSARVEHDDRPSDKSVAKTGVKSSSLESHPADLLEVSPGATSGMPPSSLKSVTIQTQCSCLQYSATY
ncbi:unnamed protein product [Callosobruchus maculatus]|uniref:Uncharacterized protein n=1 Tax=Callosobruchus maculatus TaxID=64391 RepID=A0A653D3P9_CALMS|nr:unnamed protein product [Callosobruchus maculatus]